MYSSPGDSYQIQQQNVHYQTQYNYNQSLMDQGGSQYQNVYQQQQQTFSYVEHQPQAQSFQPSQTTVDEGESWNISQNKASYVVSIAKAGAAPD